MQRCWRCNCEWFCLCVAVIIHNGLLFYSFGYRVKMCAPAQCAFHIGIIEMRIARDWKRNISSNKKLLKTKHIAFTCFFRCCCFTCDGWMRFVVNNQTSKRRLISTHTPIQLHFKCLLVNDITNDLYWNKADISRSLICRYLFFPPYLIALSSYSHNISLFNHTACMYLRFFRFIHDVRDVRCLLAFYWMCAQTIAYKTHQMKISSPCNVNSTNKWQPKQINDIKNCSLCTRHCVLW